MATSPGVIPSSPASTDAASIDVIFRFGHTVDAVTTRAAHNTFR